MEEPPRKKSCFSEISPGIVSTVDVEVIKPKELRHLLLDHVDKPVVLKGYLDKCSTLKQKTAWQCLNWPLREWEKVLGKEKLQLRIGKRVKNGETLESPQWEGDCMKAKMTFGELLGWAGEETETTSMCGQTLSCADNWAYFDYQYIKDMIHLQEMEKIVSWEIFGFPERGARESTLWIGTEGANTPCHIDTYGCNLVAQVHGSKRWTLFPQVQSDNLYTTRIPYEESSIYSDVGFPHPDTQVHPKLEKTTPYTVTLEKGDVLYVPHKWWHFVEHLDFSISINTWIELDQDEEERSKEALTMFLHCTLTQGLDSEHVLSKLYNPNMLDVASLSSAEALDVLLGKVFCSKWCQHGQANNVTVVHNIWTCSKHKEGLQCQFCNGFDEKKMKKYGIHSVKCYSFQEFKRINNIGKNTPPEGYKKKSESCVKEVDLSSKMKIIIDAFTDERVVNLLKEVICEKMHNT